MSPSRKSTMSLLADRQPAFRPAAADVRPRASEITLAPSWAARSALPSLEAEST